MNKKIICILFITLFTVLTVNLNIVYAEDQSDIIKTIKINHFKKYNDNYYRGAHPKNNAQYEELKALGIKTIIDLRLIHDTSNNNIAKQNAEKYGFKYFNIRLRPWSPPSKKAVKKFFEIVNDPEYQPVFVHCTYGEDRTGIMSALYRADHDNWTFDEAYDEMLKAGYHKRLYWRQKRFLKKYYKQKEAALNKQTKETKNN